MIVAALVLVLLVAGAGSAQQTPVVWSKGPSDVDVLEVYPQRAWSRGYSGRATVSCLATPDGKLTQCSVVSEAPEGMGFGRAAVRLAPRYRVAPVDPHAAFAGGQVRFEIAFNMPRTR